MAFAGINHVLPEELFQASDALKLIDKSAAGRYHMQKDNGHLLSGIQTVIFLELPKIDALGNVPTERLNSEQKWCKFFLDADNPDRQEYVRKLAAEEGGIMEAQKTLDKLSSDWVLWKRELDRDVIESDRKTELQYMQEQGIEKGLKQGISQEKMDVAGNMKNAGIPSATIAQCTGLSEEEIAGL
ncbi:MAG: hypothetical protein M0P01_12920 [Treponema sp.]|nr:hypothetical protein [Treponema sp.]